MGGPAARVAAPDLLAGGRARERGGKGQGRRRRGARGGETTLEEGGKAARACLSSGTAMLIGVRRWLEARAFLTFTIFKSIF